MGVIVEQKKHTVIVDQTTKKVVIKVGGVQGAPGVGAVDALTIAGRLSEFNTEQAKTEARQNLDLQVIDLGTFN